MIDEGDHIQMANTPNGAYVAFCLHCGERWIPTLPIPMNEFSDKVNRFVLEHKDCKQGEQVFTVEQMKMV